MFAIAERRNLIATGFANAKTLTPTERAMGALLAPAYSIAISLKTLVFAGHFFSAEILHRSLLERVGVASFILKEGDRGLRVWQRGWRKDDPERPSIGRLLDCIPELEFESLPDAELTAAEYRKLTLARLHSVVHADPDGTLRGLEPNIDGDGFMLVSGPMLNNPTRFREIADNTTVFLAALFGVTQRAFPEAPWPRPIPFRAGSC